MDVITIANVQSGISAYSASNSINTTKKLDTDTADKQTQNNTSNIGEAYSLEISDEGKNAQKTKGLTDDQVRSLQEDIAISQQTMLNMMIQALTDNNDKLQGWLDDGIGTLNFGGIKVDASKFALPSVATNPEDAAKAVADGGDWSVNAVSDRIFGLAETLAGGDPEKLQEMRAAVEEGFAQAGATWQSMTGTSAMPDITSQTYNELMHRFDARMQELAGGAI